MFKNNEELLMFNFSTVYKVSYINKWDSKKFND